MILIIACLTYVFLVVRFFVTLSNFLTKPLLPHSHQLHTDLVSILVPARNEAQNLPVLLQNIRLQDYSNYELLILDDDSSDETATIVEHFSQSENSCKLIVGEPLPADWFGKNWACHQLAQQATGKYLLFIDADVQLRPGLISSVLTQMKTKNLSLLSVFNDQITTSLGEKLVVPLMHYLLLTLLPLKMVYTSKDHKVAAASGQCMCFESQTYLAYLFHKQAKKEVTEDIRIMQMAKKQGLKAAAFLANGFIWCRMYRSYKESILGFSKNLMAGFGDSALLTSLFVVLVSVGYLSFFSQELIAIFTGSTLPFLFYSSILFLIISIRIMVSILSNQNIITNLLFHPLQIITMMILLLISIYKRITNSNRWKGRLISTK